MRVHMLQYKPFLLKVWIGEEVLLLGHNIRQLFSVYMTFFPNDVIRKFFPDFDDTRPIQYQEPKLITIVLRYIMPG